MYWAHPNNVRRGRQRKPAGQYFLFENDWALSIK
jgi:hypothetical protein